MLLKVHSKFTKLFKVLVVFIFVFFAFKPVFAQLTAPDLTGKTYDEKLATWLDYCKKANKVALEGSTSFTRLMFIDEAKKGIALCRTDDLKNLAQYQYIVGRVYQQLKQLDSAIFYLENAKENYNSTKMLKEEVAVMQFLNYAYYQTGKFAERDKIINQLKGKLNQTVDLRTKNSMFSALGEYYYDNAQYEQAIKYKLETIKILEKLILTKEKVRVDSGNLGIVNVQMAETYLKMKQYANALSYLNLNSKNKSMGGSKQTMANVYNNYISAYLGLNKLDSAKIAFGRLKKLVDNQTKFEEEISISNRLFAEYYLQNKQTDIALKFNEQAQLLAVDNGKIRPVIEKNFMLGKMAYAQGKYQEAIKYLNFALPNAYNLGKEDYAAINHSLALCYEAVDDFKNASKHFKIYAAMQDTLNNEASKQTIAEMDAKYHRSINEQKIKLLNIETDVKTNQLKEEKTTRWFLIGGAFLLLVALVAVYFSFRTKKRANLLLDKKNHELDILNDQLSGANQTKAKLFSIISHDLRSPVSQLFTFLKLQQASPNSFSEEERSAHQKKLMLSSTNLLSTMEDLLLWSKSQMDHFELDIEEVDILQLFNDSIASMQNQAEAKNLKIQIGEMSLKSVNSDENLLTIVLRNLLQNAINYSFNDSTILLNAGYHDSRNTYISISNRGTIISKEKIEELLSGQNIKSKSSGYGLLIVKELLFKLTAELEIKSNENLSEMTITFN